MSGELERISSSAVEAIEDRGTRVLISAVVIWEVAIKRQLGKLDAPPDLLAQLERAGVDLVSITPRHADRVGTLPMRHRDPFDRLLVAQADVDGLVLISADTELSEYGIEVLW